MHSIVVPCLTEEPLLTAEQVAPTQPKEGTRSPRGPLPGTRTSSWFLFGAGD